MNYEVNWSMVVAGSVPSGKTMIGTMPTFGPSLRRTSTELLAVRFSAQQHRRNSLIVEFTESNIKIQRAGAQMSDEAIRVLPAADLER